MSTSKTSHRAFLLITVLIVFLVSFFIYKQLSSPGSKSIIPGEGTMCGGIANIKCPVGLSCEYPSKSYPDQAGTCKAVSGISLTGVFSELMNKFPASSSVTYDSKPQRTSPSENAKDYPITDTDGTIYDCLEINEYDRCTKIGYTYSVSAFKKIGTKMRGREEKVIGVADTGLTACINRPDDAIDPDFGRCAGFMFIRDQYDENREIRIENLVMSGSSESLNCEMNGPNDVDCNAPFKIGSTYVFTGTLDGEVKYYDNGQPYIIDTFRIRKFELVE